MSLILVSEFEPHKKCSRCGLVLPHSEFNRNKGKRDGLRSECKSCSRFLSAEYYKKHKKTYAAYYLRQHAKPDLFARRLWYGAKRRAKTTGMPFDIPLEWAKESIAAGVCEASGVPFCIDTTVRHLFQPSIDRIDNDPAIGYVLGNVRMVALMVNNARNDCNDEDFFIDRFLEVAAGFAAKRIHAA